MKPPTAAQRIKLRDLTMLQAIAEQGSMAKAAGVLAMTQPAISKTVAGMEQLLGVPLLDRSARGVVLTEYGRILTRRGQVAIDELQAGLQEIRNTADPEAGEVRIGTTEAMTDLVASIVATLSDRYPRMRFLVTVSDTDRLVRDLRERRLDGVITRWTNADSAPDLAMESLFQAPLAVVADRRHRLAGRRRLELAALMEERWTLSPPDTFLGRLVTLGFAAHGLKPPAACLVTVSIYMRLCLLADGPFLTVLPRQMLNHPINRPWLRALAVDFGHTEGTIGLITLRGRHVSGSLRLFAEACRTVRGAELRGGG